MCHINQGPDWGTLGGVTRRHPAPPAPDPQLVDEQKAAIAAGTAAADWKRRRAASALQAGSRGLVGQPSVLGAAAASSGPASRGTTTYSSVLGAAGGAGAGGGR